jgi:hypothetical protein
VAISTFDGASAGARNVIPLGKSVSPTLVAGRPHSTWPLAGIPGAGSFNGTLNGVTVSSTDAGTIARANPASGSAYVFRATGQALQAGRILILDRLWHNGGYTITSTAAQNSTPPTWPSRCPTSAIDDTPATTGFGVELALEISAATGAGTPTITIGYTNSAGTAGRTATNYIAALATSAIGAWYPIGWQAGDVGVRSVQSLTLSATWTSGTMNLVAYRRIGEIDVDNTGEINWISGGAARIYDGSALFLVFVPVTTTTTTIQGSFQETHG